MLGSPRWVGISLKQIARAPRAALRCTSATARSTSHSGIRQSGSSTPSEPALLALHERLAAEAREGRERDRAVDPAEGQVLDPRLRLVATRAHLVVGDGGDVHLRAVEAAYVAVGGRAERDGDVPLVHVDQP